MTAAYKKGTVQSADFLFDAQTGALLVEIAGIPRQSVTAAGVAVTGGYVTLVEMDGLYAGSLLNIEVSNVGISPNNAAMNHFKVQLRDHVSGDWYDYLSDSDFQSLVNPNVLFCTTVIPQTLAAGAQAHMHIRINAAASVRVQASVASGTGTITAYATVAG
jgi:hypothetical protein